MRLLSLILFSLFALSSSASHYLGGNISWTKTANGQFIFELKVYKECGGGAATYVSPTIHGPQGTITTTLDTIIDYTPECFGNQIACGVSLSGVGAVQIYVLKSAPLTLTGTPPASGWVFYWQDSAWPPLVNTNASGIYFESIMYDLTTSGSPVFIEKEPEPTLSFNKTMDVTALAGNSDDSLYYGFVSPKQSPTMGVAFSNGYTYTSPFPSSLTNASNGPVTMDGKAGVIHYDVNASNSGSYIYAVGVEQWRNGVLISRVSMVKTTIFPSNTVTNTPPSAIIDTSMYTDIIQTGPYSYKTYKTVGDSLDFVVTAADGYDQNFRPQVISFNAKGSALGAPWNSSGGFYNNQATISPASGQVGYSKPLINNINFKWSIENEHFNPHNNSHFFNLSFKDDQCPHPGLTNISLQVIVKKALYLMYDTIDACAGDSLELYGYSNTGNYSWTPAGEFSNPTISNPKALPTASGYYYLTDPTTNEKDSVYVKLTQPAAFDLDTNNHKLELTDLNGTTNRIWYYNGVPFYYPYDTLTPIGYGDYWVKSAAGSCLLISDTINIAYGSSFSVFDPNNGGYNGANMSLSGSIGSTFEISQSTNLNSVTLIGVEDLYKSGTGYDLNLKIYDANQQEVFTTDVTLTPPFFGPLEVAVGYNLQAHSKYTIGITGDTALTFKLYENVSYPYRPHNNSIGMKVSGSYEGPARQFPRYLSNYLLPVTLNTDVQVVGLGESLTSNISVYPNPAKDIITISGLESDGQVQLLDIQGKLLRSYEVDNGSLIIHRENLKSGVYLLNISSNSKHEVRKVMLK